MPLHSHAHVPLALVQMDLRFMQRRNAYLLTVP